MSLSSTMVLQDLAMALSNAMDDHLIDEAIIKAGLTTEQIDKLIKEVDALAFTKKC